MMQHMTTYASSNITTELIQKYLDENKQLILAILDNQNLGKLNECATRYQAKLQQNLMYLAAIADAQPQGPSTQMPAPAPTMQPAQQYMQQQQQLRMMSQQNAMIPSYLQQSQQVSQQNFYSQQSLLTGGGSSIHMMSTDRGMGGNGSQASPGYSDGGRDQNQLGMTMQGDMHGGNGTDLGCSSPLGHRGDGGGGHGQGNDDSEASYLKGSDGSSLN
ncbi:uncharacterized protein [Physcomitrium patens]|uniref:SS18 N-terminal domain-containing protein n=1 Tax=Physcomitrium patens TaxID=3218 RepID=A0A2K1JMH1_PHYPA|nr:GRF1-interacting factor 2-like isoform X2 [Physcomitrium patens]XP_024393362.1 GRF1-interacting factor 2-like isoform X2 [Physcomitrium patens]XP_024393364.1 GRF1-interacting factor 2-like isoform X2 [Physcomitrium patens]XP_024393365.1 GRF1-interacting factor 2-like isoform X2 [Physcomitrium patens]XP_024393366.1 GRF1-interacting factor 2-like isoform X2 [Physcomitrium patens]XP_024393367.1 GRF1-interacting factor 2-like isoform X2 [Physcomitrium patens]XP_024393368.1 GRF1-interacting fac|eukprot:XP_024393361.1 GRF1-interacting factor 2-like isoform X2 [Physcomitrella patens]